MMSHGGDFDRWMDTAEVAQLLDMGESTVRKKIRSGELKSAKFGKNRRCKLSDVQNFAQKGE
jgi:excisionase family DNA binding protein